MRMRPCAERCHPASQVGAGEWLLETHGLHLNQYLELAKAFNPVEFNAAVRSGMNLGMHGST